MNIVTLVSIQSQECGQCWCKCWGSSHHSWQVTFFCLLPDVITSSSISADASGRSSAEALTVTLCDWHFLANVATRWCDAPLHTLKMYFKTAPIWELKQKEMQLSCQHSLRTCMYSIQTNRHTRLGCPWPSFLGWRIRVIHFSICPTTDTLQLRRPGLVEHKHGGSEATEAFRSP